MYYKTVEIRWGLDGKLYSSISDLPFNREPNKTKYEGMNKNLGFWHVSRKKPNKKCIQELVDQMVVLRQKEIQSLQRSIEELNQYKENYE